MACLRVYSFCLQRWQSVLSLQLQHHLKMGVERKSLHPEMDLAGKESAKLLAFSASRLNLDLEEFIIPLC